jgi:alginate O-acetyltransferase complex protein AlgI
VNLASFQFLTFLASVYLLWRYAMPSQSSRKSFLLFTSYVFYCSWDVRFAAVLAGITVGQWLLGRKIHEADTARRKLIWLWASVILGLGCLTYFKYAGFFLDGLNDLLTNFGLGSSAPLINIVAPIGISFYTFQSLTYTIDIYRGREKPTKSLRDFALFIAFFPHVTAGPIARARLLIPQIEEQRGKPGPLDAQAVYLIVRGLVKKIAIADVLAAQFVTPAFSEPALWSSWFLLLAVVAYSFQIYMDLSGYTDLARGAARCFGYDLQINFDRPYLARTVSNFWQRWHISMSSFFREYLFWALGGSKHGNVYANLLLTFVAIGLWHGAGWTFVIYGLLHGTVVCLERAHRTSRRKRGLDDTSDALSARVAGFVYTFLFVAFARILFVETDLAGAWEFVSMLLDSIGVGGAAGLQGYATLGLAIVLHVIPREWPARAAERLFLLHPTVRGAVLAGCVYVLVALAAEPRPFVYFQF